MPTYLYVEDDPLSRQIMTRMIGNLADAAEVVVFEDSVDFDARTRALDPTPEIVFLDVQIGPLDGFAMLDVLRANPDFDAVPIIAMTASVTVSEIEALRGAGFDGLIAKPVRKRIFPELVARIRGGDSVWFVP
jgi:CheY-like chemotaxis protein